MTKQGRPTASPITHIIYLFILPAPELKLFIATSDIWKTHQEQQQKIFFCKLENYSSLLAILPNRSILCLVTMT